ncbi:MAG: FecR domain-containing protein [Bacteroidota bacterium]|nr:FecR domain-containing protein [Bacteroidota bacterium]
MEEYTDYKRITDLIVKEIDESINKEEQTELTNWLNEKNENRILYDKIRSSTNFKVWKEAYEQIDITTGRENVSHRLLKEKRYRFGMRILKYAAVILLPLFIGSSIYFFYRSSYNHNSDSTANQIAKIVPGTTKATLILANGKVINLSENNASLIQEEDGTLIHKESGNLNYKNQKREESATSLYNTINIPRGGIYNLILSDGTQVYMNSMSHLKYPVHFSAQTREVELTGEAYFKVTKDKKRPFIVKTGKMNVEVLGTSFNVNAYENTGEIVTTLAEGKVWLHQKDKTADNRILIPSEQAKFNISNGKMSVSKVDVSLYTAWKDGEFIFQDLRLEEIMTILTRWYSANVLYLNPSVKDIRFSGYLDRYSDINQILEIIKSTNKVNITIRHNTILFSKK